MVGVAGMHGRMEPEKEPLIKRPTGVEPLTQNLLGIYARRFGRLRRPTRTRAIMVS